MDECTTYQAEARRAIAILGGPVQAAKLLDVPSHRYQTVQSWLRFRVPAEYCPTIERLTRERGSEVRCEVIRPDIEWSVLRDTPATCHG